MIALLVRTIVAVAIAVTGGALGLAFDRAAKRHLTALVYAALGALLAVTVCDVLPDAKSGLSWTVFGLAAFSGFALFALVGRFAPICPACVGDGFALTGGRRGVALLLAALSLHSLMDGVLLADTGLAQSAPNVIRMLAVSFHKLPEGLALTLLLRGAGFGRMAALGTTFAVEATTVLGGLAGASLSGSSASPVLCFVLAHIGGGFVYLAAATLGLGRHSAPIPIRPALLGGVAFALTAWAIWTLRHGLGE